MKKKGGGRTAGKGKIRVGYSRDSRADTIETTKEYVGSHRGAGGGAVHGDELVTKTKKARKI